MAEVNVGLTATLVVAASDSAHRNVVLNNTKPTPIWVGINSVSVADGIVLVNDISSGIKYLPIELNAGDELYAITTGEAQVSPTNTKYVIS